MKKYIVTLLLFIISSQIFSQPIFIPKENQQAYTKNTRSVLGSSGAKYWQNSADYIISAEVNPPEASIKGEEVITYYNNSPDTLKSLFFHLYANLYKKGSRTVFNISPTDINDGVKISFIKISNEEYPVDENDINGTILKLKLKSALAPSSQIKIEFKWSLSLPKTSWNKVGAYSATDIFAGLWYPKICVYDDIRGWNTEQYTGLAEFYNEFGNYDVKIKLPEGYFCTATGILQNPEEVFRSDIFSKYEAAKSSKEINHIITEADYTKGSITKNNSLWHFKAENVSDFAFGISNHYLLDGCTADIGTKKVYVYAAYNKKSQDFVEVCDFAKKSIEYFSSTFPGIEYPFPQITVYNGDDGMEFPMIINDGAFDTRDQTVYVTTHEILHQYIPFLAGADETRYGWMDESFAVYIPEDFQTILEPTLVQSDRQKKFYSRAGGKMNDIPLMIPSFNLTPEQYFGTLYGKGERALYALGVLIGKEKLMSALKTFLTEWSYQHPSPYDFFYTIERVYAESLGWFWQKWYFEYSYVKYDITATEKTNDGYMLRIRNIGGAPAEFTVKITYDDGSTELINGIPFRGETYELNFKAQKNLTKAEIL